MSDILALLRRDHEHLQRLAARVEGRVSSAAGRRHPGSGAALRRLLSALERHEDIESRVLFPAIRDTVPGAEELLEMASIEHGELAGLMRMLNAALAAPSARPASPAVEALAFTTFLRRHLEREEEALFPLVARHLPRRLLEELGAQALQPV